MTNWRPLEQADLTPELIGKKVRFADNELNRAEGINIGYEINVYRFKTIDKAIHVYDPINDERYLHYSRFEIEESKFAGVKVGMYAHLNNGDYQRITAVKKTAIHCDFDCYAMLNGKHIRQRNLEIVEIVLAYKVIVDFGAFRGTIRKNTSETFFVYNGVHNSLIRFDMLLPEKQAEIKELLEAIEKEKVND